MTLTLLCTPDGIRYEPPDRRNRRATDESSRDIGHFEDISVISDIELSSIEVLHPKDADPGDEIAAWGYRSGSVEGDRSCTASVASDNGWGKKQPYQHT